MKILHVDTNHPVLEEKLAFEGFENYFDFTSSKEAVAQKINAFDGLVIRSRFPIDRSFLASANKLKFIARVGAGLENIDVDIAADNNIKLIAAPEGNRNAVAEHALGMLLSLFNKLNVADSQVRRGLWNREQNRGIELDGKTVGIIGYGNMGKAFARKLSGFDVEVLCYDVLPHVADAFARQVTLQELQQKADVVSLHIPYNEANNYFVNTQFINNFKKPFWLINTSRGKNVNTPNLVEALKLGKILGAGLDVLEYEKSSFEKLFEGTIPKPLDYLMKCDNVLLTPHIAGWTHESNYKLAVVIADKIISFVKERI